MKPKSFIVFVGHILYKVGIKGKRNEHNICLAHQIKEEMKNKDPQNIYENMINLKKNVYHEILTIPKHYATGDT